MTPRRFTFVSVANVSTNRERTPIFLSLMMHKREETLLRELDHANLDENGQPIDEVLLQNSPHGLASPVELTLTGNHVTTANTKPIIHDQSQHSSIVDLDHLRSRINRYVYSLSLKGPLKFAGHPTIDGPYVRLDQDDILAVNSGLQALEPRHPINQSLLTFQNNLIMSMKETLEIETHRVGEIAEEKDALIKRIVRELDRIDDFKEKEWERQRRGENDEDSDTSVFQRTTRFLAPSALGGIFDHPSYAPRMWATSSGCVTATRLLAEHNSPFGGMLDRGTGIARYPKRPTYCHRPTPTSRPCNTKLWKTRVIRGNQIQYPIRTYLHQDLKQWIARFLSRPGVEDLIDSAARSHEKEDMEDIWHASTFCQFPGPDGKPFLSPSIQEGRYVFSLGVDGFNPFQNKVAKQNVTVTGIKAWGHSLQEPLPPSTLALNLSSFIYARIEVSGGRKANQSTEDMPSKPVIPPRPSKKTLLTDAESARLLVEGAAMVSDLSLLRFTKPTLASLCDAKNERRSGNKNDLVGRLLNWRLAQNLPSTRTTLEASSTGKEVRNSQRKAEEYISASSEVDPDTLMSYTRIVLVALCSERHLSIVGQKKILVQRLVRWRAEQDQQDRNDHEVPADFGNIHNSHSTELPGRASDMNDDQLHRVILGQSLVTEIRKDMLRTELPTWVSRAPKALGSTAQGKLSADQWRAACTINMIITLVRLWGRKDGVVKAMLDNYMDLVTAVELGCMLIISPGHISQYDFYMQRYLENFKNLYKTLRLVPSHHISLHLGEFLCSFGPVHAWRAFAFERYNYLLQRENTNGKFANFRTLIQEGRIRAVVSDMVDAYSKFAGEDRRGTRIRDVLQWEKPVTAQGQTRPAAKEVVLEGELYSALLQLIDTTEQFRYVGEGDPFPQAQNQRLLVSSRYFFTIGIQQMAV
ncbi:hypothetical protein F4604DRAFT_1691074 [Suillus subluteus]|nr:hypothetical protein F4604DRAFT_1691074 [Suillus subluteus]